MKRAVYDEVFDHAVLRDAPPVLVDVGASGELHPAWRRIARYAIGVGFEPDARERPAHATSFREWITIPNIVVAEDDRSRAELVLTRFPFCSSTLVPDHSSLAAWAFAPLFEETGRQSLPAGTLKNGLEAHGLTQLDWLKCDTQGTDLRIWLSLPPAWRARVLAAEFEPGLIDAYQGEDKLHALLAAMEHEHLWLARFEVQSTLRAKAADLARWLGPRQAEFARKYGPAAPAWANVVYLRRDDETANAAVGLRERLLRWVWAMELDQPAQAAAEAEAGLAEHREQLCVKLRDVALGELRGRLRARLPGVIWNRVKRVLRVT